MTNNLFRVAKLIPVILLVFMYSCGASRKADAEFDAEFNYVPKEEVAPEPLPLPEYLAQGQIESKVVWKLVTMNGKTAADLFDKIPTLSFDTVESRVQGNAGCNRYSGSYVIGNNTFSVSRIITTRMMCNNKNDEAGFTRTLEGVNASKMTESSLVFLKDNEVVLEFVKE